MKTPGTATHLVEGDMDMCAFSSRELDIEQTHLQRWGEDGGGREANVAC